MKTLKDEKALSNARLHAKTIKYHYERNERQGPCLSPFQEP